MSFGLSTANLYAAVSCTGQDLSSVPVRYNVDFSTQIQPIFDTHCTQCHNTFPALGGLNLNSNVARGNLVNMSSQNPNAGIAHVTPNAPDSSFLFKKINCTDLDPQFGSHMPQGIAILLPDTDQAVILDWILQGAPAARDPDRIFGDGFGRNYP